MPGDKQGLPSTSDAAPALESQGSATELAEAEEQNRRFNEQYGATWDGEDDPSNPYNWSSTRKISISVIVSFGQLVTLMSTSMMAAALGQIGHDLGISESTVQITFSIFVLGLAFAPFPIAALSEMYGRKSVWLVCNTFYIIWNALCPVGNSPALMVVGRFMAGSGASVGITLTGPVMADMYSKEQRGKSLSIATFVPYLGPALGPIVGGLITEKLQWHWLFWILSVFAGLITFIGLIFVQETYTPVLLRLKAAAQIDPELELSPNPLRREAYRNFYSRLRVNLLRPLKLLLFRPIIQIMALVMALNFAIYCLLLSTFSSLWIDKYGQSEFVSTLHYIAISIGITVSTQVGGRTMDYIFKKLKERANGATSPEYRVPYLVPGVLLIPIGLLWAGWSAEYSIHWIMVDIGTAIFVCGSFVVAQGMLAYLLDEFEHAASANAASRMLSNILGFAFPIFAPQMYSRLGYGWGNSLLAFIFVALGCPVPLILWKWGDKLRNLGKEK
ncbi:Efflux pump vrtL [Cladobotryum mycophilum]|uniref:Efflux pump vrtL n=1 Tax=Cladobotryum mycophilum TaxID=491253 RepID=A0ABR0SPK7_9HYPO